MNFLRRNLLNIMMIIWALGMIASVATVRADDAIAVATGAAARGYAMDLTFSTHRDANLPEQDVFIERQPGSGQVYRPTIADVDMGAALYKAARKVPHNPFDAGAVGPYARGEPFGMTLGRWLRHRGSGRYSCDNGRGHLETRFSGLVPNGVYTFWHEFTALPATRPFSGFLVLPLGARDGSTGVFVADSEGNASFSQSFEPCLQMSDAWTTSLLAINYHSDGRTHAAYPGDFGYNAHMPLFVLLPPRDGIRRAALD